MTADIDQQDFRTFDNRIALLIGITDYDHWEDLHYIRGDIAEKQNGLELVLREQLGDRCFAASNIHTLLGRVDDRQVQEFLTHYMLGTVDEHTLALVYLSGHLSVDARVGNIPCFITSSTDKDRIANTSVSFRWLVEDILKESSASVLLIIDGCFSGTLLKFHWPENIGVYLSSQHDSESFASTDGSRSRFTHYFIEGLKGAAGDKDGIVTTHSLYSYMDNAAKTDGVQEPQFHPPHPPYLLASHRPSIIARTQTPLNDDQLAMYIDGFERRCMADPLMYSDKLFVYSRAQELDIPAMEYSDSISQCVPSTESGLWKNVTAYERLVVWTEEEDPPFALILGDTGMGKSILLKRLAFECCKRIDRERPSRIPLLLNLRMYLDSRLDNPATLPDRDEEDESVRRFRAILVDWIQNELGIPVLWDEFIRLVEQGRFILVFDGLDEMCRDSRRDSIETCLHLLSKLMVGKSKILLSCRTHYFPTHEGMFRSLLRTRFLERGARVHSLREFSETEIEQIVRWRLSDQEKHRWEKIAHDSKVGISDLSRRPFLLDFFISFIQKNIDLTPRRLYEALLQAWFDRDEWRFRQFMSDFEEEIDRSTASVSEYIEMDDYAQVKDQSDSRNGVDAQDDLSVRTANWHRTVLERFLETIAMRMRYRRGVASEKLNADDIPNEIKDCFQLMPQVFVTFFEYCLRTCSLMSRSEDGDYGFVHDSIQAYFASRFIIRELCSKGFNWDQAPRSGNPPVPVTPWSLGYTRIADDHYLLEFLLDFMGKLESQRIAHIIHEPELGTRIRDNPNTLFYLFGNALTLLYRKHGDGRVPRNLDRKNISGASLAGAHIPGLSLRYSTARDIDFSEANLSGGDFTGAQFENADFHAAILKEVKINGDSVVRLKRDQKITAIASPSPEFVLAYEHSLPPKGRKFRTPSIDGLTKLVPIEGGRFLMGSDDIRMSVQRERPAHEVIVKKFYLEEHPVTNIQYKRFVDANPEWRRDAVIDRLKMVYYLKHWDGDSVLPGREQEPVVYVNWYAANAYAKWAGRRLPTEAEWEFALRDTKHDQHYIYPWGNALERAPDWFVFDRPLSEIRSDSPRNSYHLIDMSGNVNEWVEDGFDPDWYSQCLRQVIEGKQVVKPVCRKPGDSRILRGGSFLDDQKEFRHFACHYRTFLNPLNTNQDGGFRCAANENSFIGGE